MKIGILEAGVPPATLVPEHGTYGEMTRRLLGDAHAYETFRVCEGRFPSEVGAFDAYVVTGSRAGVHDGDAWIGELIGFLRTARGGARLVGICFGHQIMAQAFGGTVARSPLGWGVGLHRYEIRAKMPWMDAADAISVPASHQDQVLTAPPGTGLLGASAFTPQAFLAYTDQPAVSIQFHPEFTPEFSRALMALRSAPEMAAADVDRAMASLDGANDNARVGGWLNRFLAAGAVG